jgi:hypothetical protein
MTDVFDGFGLTSDLARVVALALPVAVLVTLVVLLSVKTKSRKARRAAALSGAAHGNSERAVSEQPITGASATSAKIALVDTSVPSAVGTASRTNGAATIDVVPPKPADAVALQAGPVTTVSPEAVLDRLNAAIGAADKTGLAPLYLELAKHYQQTGDVAGRLTALRSAAGCGAQYGPKAAHAAARIELAEIAFANGDPIDACEQWQIARMVLHEIGHKDSYQRVDKRMRDNGCPTDWVLTDF